MKCLVPVKKVIDAYVKIRVKADGSGVETQNVKMAMNPFDEIAMEEAVRLKEKGVVSEIKAVSIGDQGTQEILRQALARGADSAEWVETNVDYQPLSIAKILKQIATQWGADVILMGKQAIDDDNNQTGQMLGALLEWPQATFASQIDIQQETNKATVVREVDGGLETIEVQLPAIITVDLRLNEPRYISLPNVMKAKRKPINQVAATEFDVPDNTLKVITVEPPPERQGGRLVESVDELVSLLKDEAKVI